MITIKLTKKEADALTQGSICLELEREVCKGQFDELHGKNLHCNFCQSLKIWFLKQFSLLPFFV